MLTLSSQVYGITDLSRWDRAAAELGRSVHEITFEVLHAEAEKLARMVKEQIDAQPPSWPPLNENYKNWKEKVGLNTDMLKATEAYYNAIGVQEVRNQRGQFSGFRRIADTDYFTIRVGVPYSDHPGLDEDDDSKPKIKYTELAEILEYGTQHIPARPHWGVAYRRWRSQHARSIRARVASLLSRRFNEVFRKHTVKRGKNIK